MFQIFLAMFAALAGGFFAGYTLAAKAGSKLFWRKAASQGAILLSAGSEELTVIRAVVTEVGEASGEFMSGSYAFRPSPEAKAPKGSLSPGDYVVVEVGSTVGGEYIVYDALANVTKHGADKFLDKTQVSRQSRRS